MNSFLLIETSNIDIFSDKILDVEHPKNSIHTHTQLLELLHEYSKVAGYKLTYKNQLRLYILMMNYLKRKLRTQSHSDEMDETGANYTE